MILFILGSCIGSFCCLLVQRIYVGESIVFPNSHCDYCERPLKFYELIPMVSILLLRFRCPTCGYNLPKTYLFAEVSGGLLFAYSFSLGVIQPFFFLWLFSSWLLCLTDLFYYHVEPFILYPATGLMLLMAWMSGAYPVYWQTPLVVLIIFGILFLHFPMSFGGGDVQLLLCWSLFLNPQQLMLLLLLASSFGLLAFLGMRCFKTDQRELPFIPFLWVALWIVLFSGSLPVVGIGAMFAVIVFIK